jgi:HlyD family secretion protein
MPITSLKDTNFLISKTGTATHGLYISILLLIILTLALLPFINTDITIKTNGITRPQNERTDIKSIQTGIIDSIFIKEGQQVTANAVILKIKDEINPGKRIHNRFEITQRQQFIHDLVLLTASLPDVHSGIKLQSPLYIEQLNHFLRQKTEQDILLKKANKEIEMNTPLAKEKIISPKEFFDIQNNQEKLMASGTAFIQGQLSAWQQDLSRHQLELSQFREQMNEVTANAGYYEVRAPVTGIVQGMNTRYPGGFLQVNETICSISPEGHLLGECFVSSKDIGLLQVGQPVRYQVEAFDYNYFGVLTGKITSIDNDFTPVDNKPLFKVRCSFDSTQLHLKNGFTGRLKKGLGFRASFTVARRSLWQLLFDKLDDWLNPNAPPQTMSSRQ